MRLHCGSIPEDPDFHPKEEGWRGIREPGPILLQLIAIPISLAVSLIVCIVILVVVPGILGTSHQIRLAFGLPGGWQGLGLGLLYFLIVLAAMTLIIFLHEWVHALLMPEWGATPRTLIAVWPEKLLFYAHHLDALSRSRYLIVFLGPLVALTMIPIVLMAILNFSPAMMPLQRVLAGVALFNAASASGDILGFFLVLLQIPPKAIVRNQGWKSYWKVVPGTA